MSDDGFSQLGNGTHAVRVDHDFVIVRSRGVTMVEDLLALDALYEGVRREHQSLFVLYDSRAGQGVDRAARKILLEPARPESRPDASASFGAKFSSRILIGMIDRVLAAFSRPTSGLAMFEAEDDARAYLEKERIRLNKQRPSNR
jgi:hypothetical protein